MNQSQIRYDIFIKGELLDLVVLTEQIAQQTNWYNWFNDEDNTRNMQKHYFPNTRENQLDFFRNEISANLNKLQLGIYHQQDGLLVGIVALSRIDFLNRKCEISGFIGEKKYQIIKYIVEAFRLMIKHAFMELNMNRIYGGTISEEILSLLVRVLNFKHEGTFREDVYKSGRFVDVYCVSLLRSTYLNKVSNFSQPTEGNQ